MENKVKEIMARVFDVSINKINEKTNSVNLGAWDSLKHINLIIELEKEFKIHFEAEEIIQLLSYKSIVEIVSKKIDR
jgi:acyl carrier protein